MADSSYNVKNAWQCEYFKHNGDIIAKLVGLWPRRDIVGHNKDVKENAEAIVLTDDL